MQLLTTLSKLFMGEERQPVTPQKDERSATRPMQAPRDQEDRTRPSRRIRDEKWLQIQKVIDQAG